MHAMYCTECRICKGDNLHDVIDLGEQAITSRFPVYGDFTTPKVNVCLCLCKDCGLLQLRTSTASSEMYEHEYGYRSGINETMRAHLLEYKNEIVYKSDLCPGDTILDIGSNDCTMLGYYDSDIIRIGVDPTGKQFLNEYIEKSITLVPTYFTKKAVTSAIGNVKCKVISSISMFYDLPDPVQFAKDVHFLLADNGIWTCEQSYMPAMLKTNSIDTVCHEHLEYYSLHQIKDIADRANLKIIDVKFNDCNGGSFRVYLAKTRSEMHTECTDLLVKILKEEDCMNLKSIDTFARFIESCNNEVGKLKKLITDANKKGERVYIYGASTKGNCLLQYANISEHDIKYAVERNPKKFGKMTSTGIKIISEEEMRADPPEYLLVLPWHFKKGIVKREAKFLENGGMLLFPFPTLTRVIA